MKRIVKTLKSPLLVMATLLALLSGCVVVDNTPGPPGRPGFAYFGVDFDYYAPYSYWDNNPSIPLNPVLGTYYPTNPGIFQFEYFVTPHEYWYGTYEVFINPGGPGGPYGEPGFDGLDTYLMLICNPDGFYYHATQFKMGDGASQSDEVVVEGDGFKVTMRRANVQDRPSQATDGPKFTRKQAS